ncbi:MAG: T9SS type A sorting domain-containing protein [Flavobacteriaceae bacterium]|nr:T9SS type A sorting domain-containing protein [Flavobacteriaceae bacterium]
MKLFFAIVIMMQSCLLLHSQAPTLFGVHGSSSPQVLQDLGAQIARYGFTDYQIKNAINNNSTQAIDKAINLNNLGIKQVVHLTWPDTTSVNEYERIPVGIDSIEVFQYLDTLITSIGPYIDYIQISQEPFGATSYNPNEQITNVIDWWKAVALFIRNKQSLNPTELGHIQLITGGITGVNGAIADPNSQIAALIDSVINFGETYCDAIAIHMHVVDTIMGENIINYIKSRTNFPLACTEWSQAKAAMSVGTNWINLINTTFDSTHPYYGLTNKQVMYSAYLNPMDGTEWDSFISTSPFTPNFIPDFYSIMDINCFEFVCFGGAFQFGSPGYDWASLYASKTVSQTYPNNPFFSEFVNVSYLINNGLYTTNCSLLGISDNNYYQQLNIYPNPFYEYATIEFNNNNNEIYTLSIFNILGKKVREISNIKINKIVVNRDNLRVGIYFLRLYSNNQIRGVGKFIIK